MTYEAQYESTFAAAYDATYDGQRTPSGEEFSERLVTEPVEGEDGVPLDAPPTFALSNRRSIIDWHREVTSLECLREVGEACPSSCRNDGRACDCTSFEGEGFGGGGSGWRPGEPGVVVVNERPQRYCVDGDRLTLEMWGQSDEPWTSVFERQ